VNKLHFDKIIMMSLSALYWINKLSWNS